MGENDVVRRRELYDVRDGLRREIDQLRADHARWIGDIAHDVDVLAGEHDTDMESLRTQRETEQKQAHARRTHRWEWRWEQVVATTVAAIALAALYLQATGR